MLRKIIAIISVVLLVVLTAAVARGETVKIKNLFIKWKPVQGAFGYKIEILNDDSREVTAREVKTSEVDLRMQEGGYSLRIGAMNVKGIVENWSEWKKFTVVITNPPMPPADVRAERIITENNTLHIKLTWKKPDGPWDALTYIIITGSGKRQKKIAGIEATEYLLTDLPRGDVHRLTVFSVNKEGEESLAGAAVIVKDRMIELSLDVKGFYIQPIMKFGDLFDYGGGFKVNFSLGNAGARNLNFGIETGFFYLHGREGDVSGHYTVGSSYIIPLCFTMRYLFEVYGPFLIMPSLSAGYTYNSLEYYSGGLPVKKRFWDPMVSGGVLFIYRVNHFVTVSLGAEYGAIIEPGDALSFILIECGITFRVDYKNFPKKGKM